MSVLKFLGAAIYGIIFSYLIWLLFYFLIPWLMGYAWTAVILFLILGTTITGILISFYSVLLSPLTLLVNNTVSKIIPVLAIAFYGYSTVMLPWRLNMEYSGVKIALGALLSIDVLVLFGSALYSVWSISADKNN